MEVVEVDRLEDRIPVLVNRLALESDGVILVNRIKPHTSFRGPFESGLMKMMTIGLGSHRGATVAHSRGAHGLATMIPAWGKSILQKAPILMGVALIENAYEETGRVVALTKEDIPKREPQLLEEARQAMPRLLAQGIDLLIVEQIGKDISGTGMDTNVIGRMMLPGVKEPEAPGVSRIVVLDLTERTNGNANGMGLADIVTRRLVDRIDHKATYANAFTSTYLNRAYIPVIMETDQDAIATTLQVAGVSDPSRARIVRIKNTLSPRQHSDLGSALAGVRLPPTVGTDRRTAADGFCARRISDLKIGFSRVGSPYLDGRVARLRQTLRSELKGPAPQGRVRQGALPEAHSGGGREGKRREVFKARSAWRAGRGG